jgi:hypothetical protein
MKVVWTDTAKRNPGTIHDYIAQTSPAYAKSMVDRLTSRSKQIGVFPLSGRVVPEFGIGQSAKCYGVLIESSPIFDLITLMSLVSFTCHEEFDRGGSARNCRVSKD